MQIRELLLSFASVLSIRINITYGVTIILTIDIIYGINIIDGIKLT